MSKPRPTAADRWQYAEACRADRDAARQRWMDTRRRTVRWHGTGTVEYWAPGPDTPPAYAAFRQAQRKYGSAIRAWRKASAVCPHGAGCFSRAARAGRSAGGLACGVCRSTDLIQADHMLPLAAGGMDCGDNLQWLCQPCNGSKSGRTMAQWHAALLATFANRVNPNPKEIVAYPAWLSCEAAMLDLAGLAMRTRRIEAAGGLPPLDWQQHAAGREAGMRAQSEAGRRLARYWLGSAKRGNPDAALMVASIADHTGAADCRGCATAGAVFACAEHGRLAGAATH